MGKERHKDNALKTYVLKVNMHCCCNGCIKKIKDGVKEIILSEGVDSADLVVEKSEVTVVGTMDPENLCCLFHELTRKDVKIETRRNMSGGGTTPSQETNNRDGQAPPDSFARETTGRLRNSLSASPVMPSAPPLPETWRGQAVPSERCAYRWSAPSAGALCVWTASDVAGILAVYEL
ncbi:uncharacterized protein LOC100845509 isoform X1 [Brachypodium distachyon]|uniref:HMA domain-containing protein n=1 Tax=Brachypodium distachyon TaxID=15368 RepID=A0A2K2D583_BRADI|nr:uncharacterized protein LOC100845509 isoform X1 [Brachypodium distachyon]PNT69440.1 hypothetical protein BRADI_3g55475v3 [Brachypodium distachyon]|eukprot:XP_014756362.1 uncharacterized protein LOC100845509 isoform X1 [Brachypodium distachyon]